MATPDVAKCPGTRNGSAPLSNFSRTELFDHYAAVRRRLFCSPPAPPKPIRSYFVLATDKRPVAPPVITPHWPPLFEDGAEPEFLPEHMQPKPEKLTRSSVLNAVCRHYGMARADVIGHRRCAAVVLPRHVACYLIRCLTKSSWAEIGRQVGKRDHTTCIHAYRRVVNQMATDPELQASIAILTRQLGSISQ